MRLIDADKLESGEVIIPTENGGYEYVEVFYKDDVDNALTEDAVEVVRCKDCKKYIPCQKLPIGTSKWCDLFDRATCEMNYCGWGERREDADE